ncbi:TraB/GumN family protein [Xenorhabdus bovienii]|uniref:TraB/GumN family protein n=1 Tax=Xenorhabdus bovienii TaxID=40576 RepID=UPI00237D0832|nr:TraB/GumN family protein [Xenorhabdus bovienii]MDE1488119.1 TraB/GumN family protein [Xenorhabdus bovienii]MDE9479009.1 TraB/GumN family protein [Xenorhabdus bovienii]MDE9531815.1 TraB/GumN family protein [Xenorhabdus bovienii]
MGKLMTYLNNVLGLNSQRHYPYPAFDITLPQNRYLHIVGSIHMGTENMFPLSEILLEQLEQCDALIVEADITQPGSPFKEKFPEQVALSLRLSPEHFDRLTHYCHEIQYPLRSLDALPSWQVALILQAAQAQYLGLRPQYGIDCQLLDSAKAIDKTIIELEGTDTQVNLLASLPNGGLSLLEDTLIHWHTNARALQTMISWWMNYKPAQPNQALPQTFCEEIHQTLMAGRNHQWSEQLHALPAGKYLVAVGALHLHGENNLLQMMERPQG